LFPILQVAYSELIHAPIHRVLGALLFYAYFSVELSQKKTFYIAMDASSKTLS